MYYKKTGLAHFFLVINIIFYKIDAGAVKNLFVDINADTINIFCY